MTIDTDKINQMYRHHYHLMPECGWMNDPNGFSCFNNEYHLFYQHYPYDTMWGPMHWAHAVSPDLIRWTHKEIALKPDKKYDRNGIFSGSGLQVGNEHWLYYTGHTDSHLDLLYDEKFKKKSDTAIPASEPLIRQVQCLARSEDGVTYKKFLDNPIIGIDQIPEGIRIEDFRDPKVWVHNNKFFMAVGSKSIENISHVLFYVSTDGVKWEFLNRLTLGKSFGTVWECPDLFELDGKHVLLFSPQDKPRVGYDFENVHSSMALIGSFDYSTGEFTVESDQEIDQGFDFYAPQSLLTLEGKRVMIAWMNMWDMKYPLHELGHGWNGSMTLPRELSIKDGRLIQRPYHTIENYQDIQVELNDFIISGEYKNDRLNDMSQRIDIKFNMEHSSHFSIDFFKGAKEKLTLTFNKNRNQMVLDRKESTYAIENLAYKNDYSRSQNIDLSKEVKLSVFLDVSSIEIFVNGGELVFTSLFFTEEMGGLVSFSSNGRTHVNKLLKWTIS
ncbi:glycoside hydrolase family 32 protein [Mesobacillus subterraneus]|uniref:glycoside hydrolase family 32 protein n=1 Tax=Mesobacillus subterraneus TaxID=285983 RepID=UPI00274004B4|nr:glycoside hydrolase family 32 protein [Mesobacillus subterraneus]WLR57759.1 glycoside hydrolase family 32 protein [Mesobacillus subterraneus]